MTSHIRLSARAFGGNRLESDRLRPLFQVWIGKRGNRQGLEAAGIDYNHGSAWLAGRTVLADRYQVIVRGLLDKSGVQVSPCS